MLWWERLFQEHARGLENLYLFSKGVFARVERPVQGTGVPDFWIRVL